MSETTNTDPTTQRMKDETRHDCAACPSDARNLGAVLHNLVGAIDVAREYGDWSRVFRKTEEARRALETWEPTRAAHFEALKAWERP